LKSGSPEVDVEVVDAVVEDTSTASTTTSTPLPQHQKLRPQLPANSRMLKISSLAASKTTFTSIKAVHRR